MRNMLAATAAALSFTLAGCGDTSPPDPDNQQIEVVGSDAYQRRIQEMPEGQRDAVFLRAIRDGGQPCQHVQSSSYVGEEQGFPVWQATCEDGGMWKIIIANDGIAQVMRTHEDAALGVGEEGGGLAPANQQQGQ